MKERLLLKLSGEALKGENGIISYLTLEKIAKQIKLLVKANFNLAIVIGAGNIFRGATAEKLGMDRSQADYMGMLGTLMNSLAMQEVLEKLSIPTRVMTSLEVNKVAETYIRRRALRHFEKDRVLILAGGTGSPYFSTDTAAALKAAELDIKKILVAKNDVDGVYSDDPKVNKDAKLYKRITYQEILEKHLKVIDQTAASICNENKIEMLVFNMNNDDNIQKIIKNIDCGTIVSYK